jgi:hypothetical protein
MALALAAGQPGCATVPPTAELVAAEAGFSYSGGRGMQSFGFPPASVVAALNEAMGDLNLEDVKNARNGTVCRVESRTSDDRPVVVTLRSFRSQSVVSVRVGWFGDEPLSKELLKRTAVRLGAHPPEAISATTPSAPSRNPYFSRDAIPDSVMLKDLAESPYRDQVIP